MNTCFLFGHACCPDGILPKLERAIESHYLHYGVRCFYVGNRGRFDSLAALAANRVKQRYPDMQLYLILAYHPGERPVAVGDVFDSSYYPPLEDTPRAYAIVKANQHMVDVADTIICYAKYVGNARNLLEYAQRRQKKNHCIIENVAEIDG